jgi:hypothetical protein
MRDFFKEANEITHKLINTLSSLDLNIGLYVGGGYSYKSTKYYKSGRVGDLDYVCVVNDVSDINKIVHPSNLQKIGYDLEKIDILYPKDLDELKKHHISIIRYSGLITDIKATLSFILLDELELIVSEMQIHRLIPKIMHNKSQNIIVSRGSDGSDIILCMASPEVSDDYDDNLKHYIIPDRNYYVWNSYIHTGTLTDLIGKGKVGLDNESEDLKGFQKEILYTLIKNSSKSIRSKGEWHKMFSSSNFFSKDFIVEFDHYTNDIASNLEFTNDTNTKQNSSFLYVSFYDAGFYKFEKLSRYSKNFRSNLNASSQIPLHDLYSKDAENELTYEDQLHIINAECKRLTTLLHHLDKNLVRIFPDLDESNLYFTNNDEMLYRNLELKKSDLINNLILNSIKSFEIYKDDSILAKYLFDVRAQFIITMIKLFGNNIQEYMSNINIKYLNLFTEIDERVQDFISENNKQGS